MDTPVTTTPTDNNVSCDSYGNLNLLGMQVKISDIIGDKIVDQFMATITPEQMENITKVLFNEVFKQYDKNEYDYDTKEYKKVACTEFKTETVTSNNWGRETREPTPIYNRAKSTLLSKYSDMISKKVEEYLNSDEYKAKAEEIAKDIVDYAIEGYKEDIIEGIRRRLVLPVTDPTLNIRVSENIAEATHMRLDSLNNYTNQNQSY